jgi:prepilin-type N-terminal cleavage/methylation domain-containing protein
MFDGRTCRPGFTIIELVIALTLSSVVLLGVLGILSVETKRLAQERETNDTWYTLRAAAAIMAWDIRQAAAGDAALDAIGPNSFIIRSPTAAGVVCNKRAFGSGTTQTPAYTMRDVTGRFVAGDSVQLLLAAETPSWEYARVSAQSTVAGSITGTASCATAGSTPTADIQIVVPSFVDANGVTQQRFDTAAVKIGVPMMAYKRVLYGITDYQGRSWLGRQVGAAIGTTNWEHLTGPLQPGGLQLEYYTAGGAATTDPLQVIAMRITLRGESYGRTMSYQAMHDTVSLRVGLRNCDPNIC